MFWENVAVVSAIILLLFLLTATVYLAVAYNIFKKICGRIPPKYTSFENMYSQRKLDRATPSRLKAVYDWYMNEQKQELSIKSKDGLQLFASALHAKNDENAKGIVLLFHGYRSLGIRDLCFQIEALHNEGYHLLIVDQRSHGKSEGKNICYGVKEKEDVILWKDAALAHFGQELPVAFMGLSMGGATVLMASGLVEEDDKNVKCVIADCPFSSPWQIISHVILNDHKIKPVPLLHSVNLYCRLLAHFNLKATTAADAVASAKLPVLIFHGLEDSYVPIEQSRQVVSAAPDRVNLVEIEGARHAEAIYFDERFYVEEMLSFLSNNMK